MTVRRSLHQRWLRTRRITLLCTSALVVVSPLAAGSDAIAAVPRGTLILPAPVTNLPTFPDLGLRPDRRLVSDVPSTVRTHEDVTVSVDGRGTPVDVQLDERLHVYGTGAYLIYERGPARDAAPIGDSLAPVLKLGTVLWQGFSPGGRDLAARLHLDPTLEAERLPVNVRLSWTPKGTTRARPLGKDGLVTSAGTVHLQLTNTTGAPNDLPTGTVAPQQLVQPLTTLLDAAHTAATHPTTAIALPTAGNGLPTSLPASETSEGSAFIAAPMRVVGTLSAPGTTAQASGPTITSVNGGGHFNGVLTTTVDFTLTMPSAGHVAVDVTAIPTLDERTLQPPTGASWAAWARSHPDTTAAGAATTQLVTGAATAARCAELSPYVGSDTKGPATTSFRFVISQSAAAVHTSPPLHPHPVALGIVAVVGLFVVSGAAALWHRS